MTGTPTSILREIASVYAATCAVTLVLGVGTGALARDYGSLLLAATFLSLALFMARREGRSAKAYGVDLAGVLEADDAEPRPLLAGVGYTVRRALPRLFSELAVGLATALVLFPPFILLFRLWHGVEHDFTFHPPRAPFDFFLGHLLAVALPEEALFRGYFQTRLGDLSARQRVLLGAQLSPFAWVVQAALFALLHFLVGFEPARLAVFFPALVFGWLRALRGGIGAAIWFHTLCNVLAELLTRGYL